MKTTIFMGKKSRYAIILLLMIVIAGFFVYKYIEFRHNNPPVKTCKKGELVNDSTGLVIHWSFDEIDDKGIIDISGNGNLGKIESAINLFYPGNIIRNGFDIDYILGRCDFVDGVKGKALSVNGREWISGDNIDLFNIDTFTVAVWVWRDNDRYSVPTIIAKGAWPWIDGWWLTSELGGHGIDMGIAWSTGFTHISSGYKLPLREWHHIAVVMNNIDNEIQFFIDGEPYGEIHRNIPKWIINRSHSLYIADFDGSGRWPWQGKLDEVRFYNKLLKEEDIFKVYNLEKDFIMNEESDMVAMNDKTYVN